MANTLSNLYSGFKSRLNSFLSSTDDDEDKIKLQTAPVQNRLATPVRTSSGSFGNRVSNLVQNFGESYKNFQAQQAKQQEQQRANRVNFTKTLFSSSPVPKVKTSLQNFYNKDLNPRAAGDQSLSGIVKGVKQDPGALWIGRGFAEAPVTARVALTPLLQYGSKVINNAGFNPQIRQMMRDQGYDVQEGPLTQEQAARIATDIGYAIRGAGSVTPFNQNLAGKTTQDIHDRLSNLTPEATTVEDTGRQAYLTAITWPLLEAAGALKILPTLRVGGTIGVTEGLAPAIQYVLRSPGFASNALRYFGGQTALSLANSLIGEKYMGKNPAQFSGEVLMDSILSSLTLAGVESTIGAFGASKILDNVQFIKNLKTKINQSTLNTLNEQVAPLWKQKYLDSFVTDANGTLMVNNPAFKAWQDGVEAVMKSELPKGNITGVLNFLKEVPAAPTSWVASLGPNIPTAQAVDQAIATSPIKAIVAQTLSGQAPSITSAQLTSPAVQGLLPTVESGTQQISNAVQPGIQAAQNIVQNVQTPTATPSIPEVAAPAASEVTPPTPAVQPETPESVIQNSLKSFVDEQKAAETESKLNDIRAIEVNLKGFEPQVGQNGQITIPNNVKSSLSQITYALEDEPSLITELDGNTIKAFEDAGIQLQGPDGQYKEAGKALQEYRFQKTSPYTTQIYHGGTAKAASEIQPGYGEYGVDRQTQYPIGGYFSEDPSIASKFGENIVSGRLPKDAKVLDLTEKTTVQDIWDALNYKPKFVSPYSSIQPDTSIEELGSQYNVLENLINQNPDIKDKLIKQGYSGLRFMDKTDGTNHPSVVIFEPNNIVNISDSVRKSGLFNTSEAGKKLIADSNGKIDAERLYLLLQEAELYPTVEKFIETFGDNDLSKSQLTEIYRQAKAASDLTPDAEQALTPDVGQEVVQKQALETGQTAQVGEEQVPVGASGTTQQDLAKLNGVPQDVVTETGVPESSAGQTSTPLTQNIYERAMEDISKLLPSGERLALPAGTVQVRTRAQAVKALRNLSPGAKVEVFNQLRARIAPIEVAPPGTPFVVNNAEQARKLLRKYPGINVQLAVNVLKSGNKPIEVIIYDAPQLGAGTFEVSNRKEALKALGIPGSNIIVNNPLDPNATPIVALTDGQVEAMLSENTLGKIEKLLYGSETPEGTELGGTKVGAGFISNKVRALQENASAVVGDWSANENPVLRNLARVMQGFAGGLGHTAEDVTRKGQYAGGIGYSAQIAADTQKYVYELVQNDAKSLERIHAVLDPDLAKTKVDFDSLTPQEQEATGVLRTISDFINDTNYKNGFLSTEQWLDMRGGKYIARAYEEYDYPEEVASMMHQGKGKLDLNPFKKRGELTDWKEENAIRDPAYLMSKRLQQTLFNDTVKKMSEEMLNTPYVSETERPGYVKVSDHKAYGELAGKYIRKDMMEDIKGFFFTHDAAQKAYDLLNWYDRQPARVASKKVLTIFNPAVQLGNKTGNYVFAWLSGIDPVTFTKNKVWANKAIDANDGLVRRMMQDGLLGTDMTKADIVNMAAELKQSVEEMASKGSIKNPKKVLEKIDDSVTGHYGKVDDIAKVSAMKTWLDRGFSYDEAARRVYSSFQNYRTVGWLYDIGAKTPLFGNPFVRFKADLGRILKNAAIDHPFRLAMTLTAWALFTKAASVLSGESEEDRKTREGRLGASRIPFTNISLEFQTPWGAVNAGRLIGPQAFNQQNSNTMLGDVSDFGPFVLPQVSSQTGMPYNLSGDPIVGPILSLLTDTDFRGKSISDPEQNKYTGSLATTGEKALNRLKYLGESFSPPGLDDVNRVFNSFTGRKDYYGRTFTPGQSIARLFGVKVEQFGSKEAEEMRQKNTTFKLNQIDGIQKKISTVYNQLGRGEIDANKATNRINALQKDIDKIRGEVGGSGGGKSGGEITGISQLDKTEKKRIQSFMEAGLDVSDQDLLNYYAGDISGMPTGTKTEQMKKQEAAFKIVDSVLESDLADDKKALILDNLGINPEDAQYYLDAKESEQVRFTQVSEAIQGMEQPEDVFNMLVNLKREVNGQAILTSGVITALYEGGIISKSMKTLLGKYKYNPVTGEVELSREAKEGDKPKKLSISATNISTPKINFPEIKISSGRSNLVPLSTQGSLTPPSSLIPQLTSPITQPTSSSNQVSPRIRSMATTLSGLGGL